MTRVSIFAIASLALAIGCKKKDEDKPAGDGDGTGTGTAAGTATAKPDAAAAAAEPDFSMWKPDEKMKAWEGSWLVKENGKIQAWTVAGTVVTAYDGEADKTFELTMTAPCRAHFKNEEGMSFPRNFTALDDGKLRYNGNGAGYRQGDKAIYCDASRAIYVLDGGECVIWEDDFGKWKKRDGECAIAKTEAGGEVFSHADPNGGEYAIEGGAIVGKSSFPTEKVDGDHEAAKKARDEKAAE